MDAALKLEGVTKRYGAFTAVRDLSFQARPGAILGFLGPNGAGKTTTLRMILGLVTPTAGRLEVLGETDGRALRGRLGFLPEERGLYRRMTATAAIAFFARLKGVPAAPRSSGRKPSRPARPSGGRRSCWRTTASAKRPTGRSARSPRAWRRRCSCSPPSPMSRSW
jgi:ABC-2 type transport system ATP-binding protein